MIMSQIPLTIDEVFRWPVLIAKCFPGREHIIKCNWVSDACLSYCLFYIFRNLFEYKFWSMDTNDDESFFAVFFVPLDQIRKSSLTIDARVGPEVDEDNLSLEG